MDIWSRIYQQLIRPRTDGLDTSRHEFILNSILSGLLAIGVPLFVLSIIDELVSGSNVTGSGFWGIAAFVAVVTMILIISRCGHNDAASIVFVTFLFLASSSMLIVWGIRLVVAELLLAMTIMITGVLLRAQAALVAAFVSLLCLLLITYLQVNRYIVPNLVWEKQPEIFIDMISYVAIFVIIGVVAWLSNHETDKSLYRARMSEQALKIERDNLEVTVARRTQELEDLQTERLLEMQPFAEFGRIGSSLVHDISNPLTVLRMSLDELIVENRSKPVELARQNVSILEKYINSARKQIKRETNLTNFSVSSELKQIGILMTHRAQKMSVDLIIEKPVSYRLYGDTAKFDQLIANLIANAIDAVAPVKDTKSRSIRVWSEVKAETVIICVHDNGIGISDDQKLHLFEPFYSTKRTTRSGLGIGLAYVKQYVEEDFNGSISVQSSKGKGTLFKVYLKNKH